MEDIIISLEPAFHRVERFILWHNRYASLLAFVIGHCLFYAMARAGLRPFCAVVLVVLIFHVLDCLKKKRVVAAGEDNLCELTRLVLRSYRHVCQTHDALNTLKMENRVKYSLLIIVVCLILAFLGLRLNGFYISYLIMLILFTLPAIVYHKLLPKAFKRLAPILEQLDQSMEYKRRSLLDPKDLLVKMTQPGSAEEEDEEVVRKLKQQQKQHEQTQSTNRRRRSLTTSDDDEESERKLINNNETSQTMVNLRERYQHQTSAHEAAVVPKPTTSMGDSSFDMLSDSSSSAADDETARISELYANMGDQIDGKHRIKIKGDELKIKGRSSKQRPKITDVNFFQMNDDGSGDVKPSDESNLINTAASGRIAEPDLTSFDFLNDYDDKA